MGTSGFPGRYDKMAPTAGEVFETVIGYHSASRSISSAAGNLASVEHFEIRRPSMESKYFRGVLQEGEPTDIGSKT